MIVVAIVGVLAALAVYGVRRYLLNAKTTEARNAVGQMGKDAKTAYERESMQSTVLGIGISSRVVNNLCLDAARPVPATIDLVTGRKYQSAPSDWLVGNSATVGFTCLHFAVSDPQYYMYDYKGTPGESGTFAATATGDLDGNGVTSSFAIRGQVSSGTVFVSPMIEEQSPEE
ncbi:MAG TPA: fimbiral protein pilA [Polyangiaceae bacterium]|nr:fimbiral protein pilA [Polyangiaceae bacterium]